MTAPSYAPQQQYPATDPWTGQPIPQQTWPPQQYAPGYPPAQPMPPAAPLAQGSIDDFYNQPSTGGGASLKFTNIGDRHIGVITRAITSADIQQQTDTQQRPLFFKDGRPKFVMKVPLQLQPTAENPDGLGQWYVKGQTRDELVRAMTEAGAPAGPPEVGALVDITFVSQRASGPGMNPAKQFRVVYTRPNGQAPQQAAPVQQQPTVAPSPAPVAPPVQAYQQPVAAPPQAPAPAQPAPAAPEGLSADQQALLARLTGAQQG